MLCWDVECCWMDIAKTCFSISNVIINILKVSIHLKRFTPEICSTQWWSRIDLSYWLPVPVQGFQLAETNFRRPAFDLKIISKHSLYAIFQGHAAKPSLPRQVAHHRVQRWRSTVVPPTWLNSLKERSSERNSWNMKVFSYTPYHGNPKTLNF